MNKIMCQVNYSHLTLSAKVDVNCGRKDGLTDGRTDGKPDGATIKMVPEI